MIANHCRPTDNLEQQQQIIHRNFAHTPASCRANSPALSQTNYGSLTKNFPRKAPDRWRSVCRQFGFTYIILFCLQFFKGNKEKIPGSVKDLESRQGYPVGGVQWFLVSTVPAIPWPLRYFMVVTKIEVMINTTLPYHERNTVMYSNNTVMYSNCIPLMAVR